MLGTLASLISAHIRLRQSVCYLVSSGVYSIEEGRMASASLRRTDRVSLTLLLEVSGTDSRGQEFSEPARTLLINRGGAVIVFERELTPEQRIRIQRRAASESHRGTEVRVVGQFGRQKDGYLY